MVWTVPKTQILEFDNRKTRYTQSEERLGFEEFKIYGQGFAEGGSGFMFVRALDASKGLFCADVIPGEDVKIEEIQRDGVAIQRIEFRASLHQREAGSYHLVGWRGADSEPNPNPDLASNEANNVRVNNACVYEFALTLVAAEPEVIGRGRARNASA